MDDLTQKLNEILNSPEGMQKLKAAAASLGILNDDKSQPSPSGADTSQDMQTVQKDDFDAIKKLMPLVSNIRKDDQDLLLLKAIRPYLQDSRQTRLDETIKVMHMLKVLPLLKDKGI